MTTTIGIINRNYSNFVIQAIQSVLSQTTAPQEIIILDDASTDNSKEVIQKYVEQVGPSVKMVPLFLEKPVGDAGCRNIILQKSSPDTKYIGYLFADDFYYKNKIEKSLEILNKYPEIGLVYSDFDAYNIETSNYQRNFTFTYDQRLLTRNNIINSNGNVILRKDLLNRIGGFNPADNLIYDYVAWIKAARWYIYYSIPETTLCIRMYKDKPLVLQQHTIAAQIQQLLSKAPA